VADDEITAALAPIRDREKAATPGPWKVEREHGYDTDGQPWSLPSVTGPDGEDILLGGAGQPGADLRFTAHAREDVPLLLAAVEALLAQHTPTARVARTGKCPAHEGSMFAPSGCPECRKVTYLPGCAECRDQFGDPVPFADCRARKAVLAELARKETGHA
jgi:hypothetical protein